MPVTQAFEPKRPVRVCASCGEAFGRGLAFCPYCGRAAVGKFDWADDANVGSLIDQRYELLGVLGEGGTGIVYRAEHTALGRHFALKVLRKDLARDPEACMRFIKEAQATARIRHPGIVEITDFGSLADGTPYFVMELLEGETLASVLDSEVILPHTAVRIALSIASVVAAAHDAGIIHRDLKPENVFILGGVPEQTERDLSIPVPLKVVDFGAAKIMGSSSLTRPGMAIGTPHYMSPEHASGKPVDARADVYALGIILYEMFTGRVPFEGDSYMAILTQQVFAQPKWPREVAERAKVLGPLEDVTMKALAKDAAARHASMVSFAEALRLAAARSEACRAVAGTPRAPSAVAMRAARARKVWPMVIVAVGFGVAMGVVAWAGLRLRASLQHRPAQGALRLSSDTGVADAPAPKLIPDQADAAPFALHEVGADQPSTVGQRHVPAPSASARPAPPRLPAPPMTSARRAPPRPPAARSSDDLPDPWRAPNP